MKDLMVSKTFIKGYHIYKVKPSFGTRMSVEREPDNKYDPCALVIKLRNEKMVGRVPANLCKIFSSFMQERKVLKISCVAVGAPTLSKHVEPQQSYRKQRQRSGRDREGGGAVIPCKYVLQCFDSCYSDVLESLKNLLANPEMVGPVVEID